MSIGIWQLVLILVIVFVVFGAGKLPRVMGDVGKGVRSLRDGLKGDEEPKKEPEKLESATPSTSVETDDSKHDKTSA